MYYSRGILFNSFTNFSFSLEKAFSFPSPGLAGSVALFGVTVETVVTGGAARASGWLWLTILDSGETVRRGKRKRIIQNGLTDPTSKVYQGWKSIRECTCSLGKWSIISILLYVCFMKYLWTTVEILSQKVRPDSYWKHYLPIISCKLCLLVIYIGNCLLCRFNAITHTSLKGVWNNCWQHTYSMFKTFCIF